MFFFFFYGVFFFFVSFFFVFYGFCAFYVVVYAFFFFVFVRKPPRDFVLFRRNRVYRLSFRSSFSAWIRFGSRAYRGGFLFLLIALFLSFAVIDSVLLVVGSVLLVIDSVLLLSTTGQFNGCAAGVAAIQHIRRQPHRRQLTVR